MSVLGEGSSREPSQLKVHRFPFDMMRVSRLLALIVFGSALGCTDRLPKSNGDASASARASVTQQSASTVWPSAEPDQDCGLLRTPLFPDPLALVHRYVDEDQTGRFMETTPLADSVYLCPGHLPGPDEFTVISRSEVEPLDRSDSVAHVVVRSQQLGRMTQDSLGFVFMSERGTVVDTFVVVRTAFGWRIDAPQLPDRVLGSAVLAHPERFSLRPVVRDSVAAAIKQADK